MKKEIFIIFLLSLVPLLIGGTIFTFQRDDVVYQVIMVVYGLVELIVFMIKMQMHDRFNLKNYGHLKSKKYTEEYRLYRKSQNRLLISAVINLGLSFVIFILFGA